MKKKSWEGVRSGGLVGGGPVGGSGRGWDVNEELKLLGKCKKSQGGEVCGGGVGRGRGFGWR